MSPLKKFRLEFVLIDVVHCVAQRMIKDGVVLSSEAICKCIVK